MKDLELIINNLLKEENEKEWFEFKENWFDPKVLGEYISAISNSAAIIGKDEGYFIWGIGDVTHDIVGTSTNYFDNFKGEPIEHYLARNLSPDILLSFDEIYINDKRLVVLTIPAAKNIPTSFNKERFIRIGSSKENLTKYPEREIQLFDILKNGLPSITGVESEYQDLTFEKLFTYYAGKGINLRTDTFKKNLHLLTSNGNYNLLAQLLSDDCHIPIRVSIFRGNNKASQLYSIKEFGNTCILIALDRILEYGDVINLVQVDERNRKLTRNDINLFDENAFREALINAFVHNKWVSKNAPMITVFSDRIEILSRGTLSPEQTLNGFYSGESVPVNESLSDIFLQLHISERSGRGVPQIIEAYGKNAFEFRDNSIVVTIPFKRIDYVAENDFNYYVDEPLSTPEKIYELIKEKPNITQSQLAKLLSLGRTAIQDGIVKLKKEGKIERVGANKNGHWLIK